jgi:hypothetical protein
MGDPYLPKYIPRGASARRLTLGHVSCTILHFNSIATTTTTRVCSRKGNCITHLVSSCVDQVLRSNEDPLELLAAGVDVAVQEPRPREIQQQRSIVWKSDGTSLRVEKAVRSRTNVLSLHKFCTRGASRKLRHIASRCSSIARLPVASSRVARGHQCFCLSPAFFLVFFSTEAQVRPCRCNAPLFPFLGAARVSVLARALCVCACQPLRSAFAVPTASTPDFRVACCCVLLRAAACCCVLLRAAACCCLLLLQ